LQKLCTHTIFKGLTSSCPSPKTKNNKTREDPTLGITSPAWSHWPFSRKEETRHANKNKKKKDPKTPTQCNDISLFLHAAGYPTLRRNKRENSKRDQQHRS
jgi:hypothetical protein